MGTAGASLVAVMDSGTDISHKDLASKAWINSKEVAGSSIDLDKDGLPGDINGWDYTANSPRVFDPQYNNLITDDVKTFYNYYGKYDLGLLTSASPEMVWLRTHTKDADLMNKVNFVGGYIHGTHVAGLSLLGNNNAKVLSMKIIPTVYQESKTSKLASEANKNGDTAPTKTYDEFKANILDEANGQIEEMVTMHTLLNFHKVDVVNQSFGIGFGDAENFIKNEFTNDMKREPTKAELEDLVRSYFNKLMVVGPKMFNVAPNTLFVIAAGNDNSNNDLNPDYPADIQAENKIVVAATLGYKKLADFSNYGATKVDVAAPGVGISSTAPTNTYIALSGTSQATPFVTNVIGLIRDINPALTARDIKTIVYATVDVKSWLRGKVKTSGIVNKDRALKAAELSKSQSLDKAISNAKISVADVISPKSFNVNKFREDLNYRPYRPSLFIKL